MYKVTSRIQVNNPKLNEYYFDEKSKEYYYQLHQEIINGLVQEMYKNRCIEIARIESNTSDFEHITYTATGYVIPREEIDKAIELLTKIKFGSNEDKNQCLNQIYDILTKQTNENKH
mgnify:CR=1 FL=1